MKYHRLARFLRYLMPMGTVICLSASLAETQEKAVPNGGTPETIVIESNSFEIDNKQNIIIFTGDVDAKKDQFMIQCQKMLVYYKNPSNQAGTGKQDVSIDKIIATGGVKIQRPDGEATAEKAVYHQDDEKVVLSGKPVIKRGNDIVEGKIITLFLKENRSIVEGSENNKAKAVLFPKDEKGSPIGP
jgi:lipopolysaccharide export system protein LptA